MTINYPYINYPNVYTSSLVPKETDPKLLEVLERIANALEEIAYP